MTTSRSASSASSRSPSAGPTSSGCKSLWVDMFGLEVKSTFVSERENVDEDICALGQGALRSRST